MLSGLVANESPESGSRIRPPAGLPTEADGARSISFVAAVDEVASADDDAAASVRDQDFGR